MGTKRDCNSRNIPLPIKREVRQRCGFGCVICGKPLYEYEHMEEWAIVKRHIADEITLLCDQHHREKTAGLLPKEAVREANLKPFNLRTNVSKPYDLHFSGTTAQITIGGNSFTCSDQGNGISMCPIIIDELPLISFTIYDGHLLLNLLVFDEFNNPILNIVENQLCYSMAPWDIQLVGKKLTIHEASRKILIEITFDPPNKIYINKGRFLHNGVEILIKPESILIVNNSTLLSANQAHNCQGGLIIGSCRNEISGFMALPQINRYLGDRTAALNFERETLPKYKDRNGQL